MIHDAAIENHLDKVLSHKEVANKHAKFKDQFKDAEFLLFAVVDEVFVMKSVSMLLPFVVLFALLPLTFSMK